MKLKSTIGNRDTLQGYFQKITLEEKAFKDQQEFEELVNDHEARQECTDKFLRQQDLAKREANRRRQQKFRDSEKKKKSAEGWTSNQGKKVSRR